MIAKMLPSMTLSNAYLSPLFLSQQLFSSIHHHFKSILVIFKQLPRDRDESILILRVHYLTRICKLWFKVKLFLLDYFTILLTMGFFVHGCMSIVRMIWVLWLQRQIHHLLLLKIFFHLVMMIIFLNLF